MSSETASQRIKTYIRDHLRDPELSIEQIAAALHCSKRYVHMAFVGEATSIEKYLWSLRLEQCRRALETTAGPTSTLTALAFSWGFNSSSHFSRLFRDKFGIAPSLYRLQLRRRDHRPGRINRQSGCSAANL